MKYSQLQVLAAAAVVLAGCTNMHQSIRPAEVCRPSPESNRQIVLAFYEEALIQRQTRGAFERYVSEDFVDHKASLPASTRSAAISFLEDLIKEVPDPTWEVVRTAAEGDLVFMHNRFTPAANAPAYAIVDIFRLKQCKIVEHWDVVAEPVKDQRNPASRF